MPARSGPFYPDIGVSGGEFLGGGVGVQVVPSPSGNLFVTYSGGAVASASEDLSISPAIRLVSGTPGLQFGAVLSASGAISGVSGGISADLLQRTFTL